MAVERLDKILEDFLTDLPVGHPDYSHLAKLKEDNISYRESSRREQEIRTYEDKILIAKTIEERRILQDNILPVVAETFGISVEDMGSKKREKEFVYPRFASSYLFRRLCDLGWTEIAKKQGGMDHSTIIYHFERARVLKDQNPLFAEALSQAEEKLRLLIAPKQNSHTSNGFQR
jgi:hypothetical protein